MQKYLAKLTCGFFYGLLNIDDQLLYSQVGSAVSRGEKSVAIKYVNSYTYRSVLLAIQYDNPEFFYWSPKLSFIEEGTATLSYRVKERDEIISVLNTLRSKRDYIAEVCFEKAAGSEEKLILYIYEYITETVSYAYDELQKPLCTRWIYDIEGSLARGRAVCLGIAQAVNYICSYLNIRCTLITGKAKLDGGIVNHGWNLVEINGGYRHLDATCDICEKNGKDFRYFLLKDEEMSKRIWHRESYPAAV